MKFSKNLILSYKALIINKSRFVFSILGTSVGIAAVITTLAIGQGAKDKALSPIKSMGINLLVINPAKTKEVFRDKQKPSTFTTLRMKDLEGISGLNHLKYISPFQQISGNAKYQGKTVKLLIQGVTEDYTKIRGYRFKAGFMFCTIDNSNIEKVAVIGSTTAEKLFINENPIDKTIYINNIQFRVIGVLQLKGLESELGNIDNVVIIPIKTFLRRISNLDYLGQIYISADALINCKSIEEGVRSILRENHKLEQWNKDDDFVIVNQFSSLKATEETIKGFNLLIISIASISLIIGGVGILVLMILSVKERIDEIGIRISVGAKKIDILGQFLTESLLIGLLGGLVGTVMGIAFSVLTNNLTSWETKLSWQGIMLPFLFSLLIGFIFGAIPAYRAANLNPVEALKSE
jgi:putative ABC transport system permease protein